MAKRQLHLNVNILNAGLYGSAWRAPQSDPAAFVDIAHYVKTAKIAERGTFDAVFLADVPAISDRPEHRPFLSLEPTIVLATVAAHTSHIGLIATASTTYNDPYNLARRFLSLDLASGGADGFNLMPDVLPDGLEAFVDHVVPILRKRGLFREAYEGTTLRDHFGLQKPENRFTARAPSLGASLGAASAG